MIVPITDHLYIASTDSLAELHNDQIDTVIFCDERIKLVKIAGGYSIILPENNTQILGVNVINLPIDVQDETSIIENMQDINSNLERMISDNRIALCCQDCINISPAMVIYYLMMSQCISYDQAFNMVQSSIPNITISDEIENIIRSIDDMDDVFN